MNPKAVAQARRLYHHVLHGGTLRPEDVSFIVEALEEAETQRVESVEALEEAVYILNPTDEDMQKKAAVYRIVTALEKLKEKNTMIGDHDKYLYEGVATAIPLLPDTIDFHHTMNGYTEVMRITKDGIWVNPDLPVDDVAKAVLDALDSQIKVLVQSAIEAKLKEKNT